MPIESGRFSYQMNSFHCDSILWLLCVCVSENFKKEKTGKAIADKHHTCSKGFCTWITLLHMYVSFASQSIWCVCVCVVWFFFAGMNCAIEREHNFVPCSFILIILQRLCPALFYSVLSFPFLCAPYSSESSVRINSIALIPFHSIPFTFLSRA